MSYNELLNNMINKSKLSLRQISNKCESYGVKVSTSYISRLKTGDQDPASEEVNNAIAKACHGDAEHLNFEAYYQKAPTIIKKYIDTTTDEILSFVKTLSILQVSEKERNSLLEHINTFSKFTVIKEIIENKMMFPNPSNPLNINNQTTINKFISNNRTFNIIDDSMSPLINIGNQIRTQKVDIVKTGDIIVIKELDKNGNDVYKTRRYFEKDKYVLLVPDNENYKTTEHNKKELEIIGKVKQIIKNL